MAYWGGRARVRLPSADDGVVQGKLQPRRGKLGWRERAAEAKVSECSTDSVAYTAFPAPPTCEDISRSTPHDTPAEISLECSGQGTLTYALASQPAHGEITDFDPAAGTLTYTPDSGFTGEDSFSYRASNSGGNSNTATVTIAVEPDPPTCKNIPVSIPRDKPAELSLECSGQGILTYELVSQPANGEISDFDSAAGTLTYTPDDDFTGTDRFTYRASNASGESNTATVRIRVRPPRPTCRHVAVATAKEQPVAIALDCSGRGTLTYEIVSQPANGEISEFDAAAGTLTQTPKPGFTGADSFSFRASNAGGPSEIATVSIGVSAPTPPPPTPPPPAQQPPGPPPPGPPSPPSNQFGFGKIKRDRQRGTAKLTVEVPGPGALRLDRTKKVRAQRKGVTAAGSVKLVVKRRTKARKRLRRRGKIRVRPRVIYTPLGGEARTRRVPVKLKLRGGRR
ncbi:MAG: tandem-95 repeat protein [Solirubrobacterales bacterium]|nr:tandem-95 repeat protein [Solirubrobacterales bacterium]